MIPILILFGGFLAYTLDKTRYVPRIWCLFYGVFWPVLMPGIIIAEIGVYFIFLDLEITELPR